MKKLPIQKERIREKIKDVGLNSLTSASIREIVKLSNELEKESDVKFIRMEMGVPGLQAPQIGTQAEIKAINSGVASIYPPIHGITALKKEGQKFIKKFLNIDVFADNIVPTVGSNQGSFATFLTLGRIYKNKNKILFIDPGFPVQKQQLNTLGQKYESFDVYKYRGDKLKDKLESYLSQGDISGIIYSNPNNPTWISFTENELEIIGSLANKYDTIVIEDLAYFGMDYRKDYSIAGEAPYQPTIANYTDNYILLISASKIFSYAGQRIALVVISPKLFERKYDNLLKFSSRDIFGWFFIFSGIYPLSSGTSHSAQYALLAMLKAFNNNEYNFLEETKEYERRAKKLKKIFLQNGFEIVYDKDDAEDIADGFYFTVAYPGLTGEELLTKLLQYGITAISLKTTGSDRTEGIRACVSNIYPNQFDELNNRLKML